MYRPAPRCSAALSLRSICAEAISGPSDAQLSAGASSRPSTMALIKAGRNLVMHGHPLGHRLELAHPAPERHGDEEEEVERGQAARDQRLRGAAGLHAQP